MEKRIPANVPKLFLTDLFCLHCDTPMKYSGNSLLSSPPQHIYVCVRCGRKHLTTKHYPGTEVEVDV